MRVNIPSRNLSIRLRKQNYSKLQSNFEFFWVGDIVLGLFENREIVLITLRTFKILMREQLNYIYEIE